MVCPWQASSILTVPIRKLFHNTQHILSPYLSTGMTTMDIGCGIGYFTLAMAGMVGMSGKVVAVDLQPEMLEGLKKSIARTGENNIIPHQCAHNTLRVEEWNGTVDFALVFYMLHEVPDPERLIMELHAALSAEGKLLFVEPVLHVSGAAFQSSLKMITECGFTPEEEPKIPLSRAVTLRRS